MVERAHPGARGEDLCAVGGGQLHRTGQEVGMQVRVGGPDDPQPALSAIVWLDRVVLLLAVVIVYLGLAVSRA